MCGAGEAVTAGGVMGGVCQGGLSEDKMRREHPGKSQVRIFWIKGTAKTKALSGKEPQVSMAEEARVTEDVVRRQAGAG